MDKLHPSLRPSLYVPPAAGPVEWSQVFGGDVAAVTRDLLRAAASQPSAKGQGHDSVAR